VEPLPERPQRAGEGAVAGAGGVRHLLDPRALFLGGGAELPERSARLGFHPAVVLRDGRRVGGDDPEDGPVVEAGVDAGGDEPVGVGRAVVQLEREDALHVGRKRVEVDLAQGGSDGLRFRRLAPLEDPLGSVDGARHRAP
jgi:hypothetical protein